MAHKTLIDGTEYDVTGGKCLIDGTGYNITKGRTLIDGTGYDLSFVKAGFDEVMADGVVLTRAYRNSSSDSYLAMLTEISADTTFYVFQFYFYYLTIVKVIAKYNEGAPPTITTEVLATTGGIDNYSPRITGQTSGTLARNIVRCAVSTDGGQTDNRLINAAYLMAVQFPNYPISVVDKAFKSITLTAEAGRNSTSRASVTAQNQTADKRLFCAFGGQSVGNSYNAAYSSPLMNVVFSDYNTLNPSGLLINVSSASLSTDGVSAASLYGGTIVSVSE